jgi:sporulation protein YlmC with PRC-barrel domain
MKHSLKELTGYTVETTDGMKGKVKDFLFDEDNWIIRYIEADFGSFFKSKRKLLPVNVITDPLWKSKIFPLNISKEEVDNSPVPEEKPTVSREYEKKLMAYYDYAAYWDPDYTPPVHAGLFYPTRPLSLLEKNLDTKLRSFKTVKGYHILATDGQLGHVKDLLVDHVDWQIIYMVIDTHSWRPRSKKVIILINWFDRISYLSKEVSINLNRETIKNAPEFDTHKPVEQAYEEALAEYYERVFKG